MFFSARAFQWKTAGCEFPDKKCVAGWTCYCHSTTKTTDLYHQQSFFVAFLFSRYLVPFDGTGTLWCMYFLVSFNLPLCWYLRTTLPEHLTVGCNNGIAQTFVALDNTRLFGWKNTGQCPVLPDVVTKHCYVLLCITPDIFSCSVYTPYIFSCSIPWNGAGLTSLGWE